MIIKNKSKTIEVDKISFYLLATLAILAGILIGSIENQVTYIIKAVLMILTLALTGKLFYENILKDTK